MKARERFVMAAKALMEREADNSRGCCWALLMSGASDRATQDFEDLFIPTQAEATLYHHGSVFWGREFGVPPEQNRDFRVLALLFRAAQLDR